jgi:hypothetical protein
VLQVIGPSPAPMSMSRWAGEWARGIVTSIRALNARAGQYLALQASILFDFLDGPYLNDCYPSYILEKVEQRVLEEL